MYSSTANIRTLMADFHIDGMMLRYSSFIPRLYNLCKSHVGYDPERRVFGVYRRAQSEDRHPTASCGKIEAVLRWYQEEYAFARDNILLERCGEDCFVTIDNQLLREQAREIRVAAP